MGIYVLCGVLGLAFATWALGRPAAVSSSPTPHVVVFGAAVGFALGAKLGFLLAEAPQLLALPWRHALLALAAGKTVTGALLGGYAGAEVAKGLVGHRTPTGDGFALVVPFSLLLGRLGCLSAGCCLGVPWSDHALWTLSDGHGQPRWAAVPTEMLFNAIFLIWAWTRGRRQPRLRGQLFHVYLVVYGVFRMAHEPLRDTPRWTSWLTGYQVLSLALVVLGTVRYLQRAASAKGAGEARPRTATT